MSDRVSFFIDGYNLYCGVREKYGHRWLWLDLEALCRRILTEGQTLTAIHYCTARVKGRDQDRIRRQDNYWKALSSIQTLKIYEGYHQKNKKRCKQCKSVMSRHEEKQTDSRIAALLVAEAMADRADTLVLLGGDSDHVPPIEVIRQETPEKKLLVCWPPARVSDELRKTVGRDFYISERLIRQSQFPPKVVLANGSIVTCPAKWTREGEADEPGDT